MGSSETDKQVKEKDSETTPGSGTTTTQDHPSNPTAGTVNPEWPGFQGYSHVPPHGYPQGHPYMWGMQHMMPPPYGTPHHPYVAMYPHGGIYAHPSIPAGSYPYGHFAMPPNGLAETSGYMPGNTDGDGKPQAVKEKLPIKRSKGSVSNLNVNAAKDNELAKTSGVSVDGVYSKRIESATEGSSDESDTNSQNDLLMKNTDRRDTLEVETSQNGNSMHGPQNGGSHMPQSMVNQGLAMVPYPAAAVPGPGTNLNINVDYWDPPTSTTVPALHGKDERELKRERRKQSNRESARRSRLRKQAECDELANRSETLKEENSSLREEVCRIRTEYEQLLAENAALKEKLGEISGHEDIRPGRNDELSRDIQQAHQTEELT